MSAVPLRATVAALVGAALGAGAPVVWRAQVVRRVENRVSAALGRRVAIGGFRPGLGGWVASDVRVPGAPPFVEGTLARAERVDAGFGGGPLVVRGLEVDYVRAGGLDNLGDLEGKHASAGRSTWTGGGAGSPARRSLPQVTIEDACIRGFVQPGNRGPRVAFRVAGLRVESDAGGGPITASARGVVIEIAGRATLVAPHVLAEASPEQRSLALHATEAAVRLPGAPVLLAAVQIEGSVSREAVGLTLTQGGPGAPGSLLARLDASGDGVRLAVDALAVPLGPLDRAARRLGLGVGRAKASLRGTAEIANGVDRVPFDVEFAIEGVDITHPAVDRSPWHDLRIAGRAPGAIEFPRGGRARVRVAKARIQALGLPLEIGGFVEPGAPIRGETTIAVAPTDCRPLLAQQAGPVREALAGLDLGGRLAFAASAAFDAANLDAMTLAFDAPQKCRVERDPDVLGAARIAGDDVAYLVAEPGKAPHPYPLGPGNPSFARLSTMPAHLPAAFITAEDAHFSSHGGFDLEMIRRALIYDVEVHAFAKGASTITQQLAKNLFLERDRTLSRKLEETVLAWRLESLLPKARILELYLNAIELGPGIYGVKRAAEVYFGKTLARLTPLESAHLASLAPNPRGLAQRFSEGRVDQGWLHHLYDLLSMMKRSGRLSAADLTAATGTRLMLKRI